MSRDGTSSGGTRHQGRGALADQLVRAVDRVLGGAPHAPAATTAVPGRPVRDGHDLADLLARAAVEVLRALPQVDCAGITAWVDGVPLTAAATHPRVLAVDTASRRRRTLQGPGR